MALADLLAGINDEGERTQLSALLDKYSPVKTALERGDAVAGAFERVAALGLDPLKEAAELPAWVDYRQKHWNQDAQKWDTTVAAESAREALQRRVAELENERGTEMTNEEVKALAEQLFTDKLKALREDPNNPLVDKNTLLGSMNLQGQRFGEIFAALTPEITAHVQKYGEPFPAKEVLDYIEKHGERDPRKAYEAILAPRDTQLQIKQLQADAQKKFEEGKAAGIAEAQAKVNGQRSVVDGGGSTRPGNHFMSRIFKSREQRATQNTRLGSGAAAQEGFAAYQKRQMGGGAV